MSEICNRWWYHQGGLSELLSLKKTTGFIYVKCCKWFNTKIEGKFGSFFSSVLTNCDWWKYIFLDVWLNLFLLPKINPKIYIFRFNKEKCEGWCDVWSLK